MSDDVDGAALEVADHALQAFKFFGKVTNAVKAVHRERLKVFLGGLGYAHEELSEEQRAKFEKSLLSPEGQALLTDYIAATYRSRSKLAIAVMAILFGD